MTTGKKILIGVGITIGVAGLIAGIVYLVKKSKPTTAPLVVLQAEHHQTQIRHRHHLAHLMLWRIGEQENLSMPMVPSHIIIQQVLAKRPSQFKMEPN